MVCTRTCTRTCSRTCNMLAAVVAENVDNLAHGLVGVMLAVPKEHGVRVAQRRKRFRRRDGPRGRPLQHVAQAPERHNKRMARGVGLAGRGRGRGRVQQALVQVAVHKHLQHGVEEACVSEVREPHAPACISIAHADRVWWTTDAHTHTHTRAKARLRYRRTHTHRVAPSIHSLVQKVAAVCAWGPC